MALEPEFSCETFHLDGSVMIVLAGDLDLCAAEHLRERTHGLVHRYDLDQVTFDCTRLRFLDAYGVRLLLDLMKRFGPTGRPSLRNPTPWVQRLLGLVDVEKQFRWERQEA